MGEVENEAPVSVWCRRSREAFEAGDVGGAFEQLRMAMGWLDRELNELRRAQSGVLHPGDPGYPEAS